MVGAIEAAAGSRPSSEQDMCSGNGQRAKPTFKERASRLTGRIREKEAGKGFGEVPIVKQCPDLGADVCPYVVRRGGDITHNLRAAIDDRDDVLEVMARDDVIATASVKCLQLGGDEQSRRDDSYVLSGDLERRGRCDRGWIPPVAEAEHGGVIGQDVNNQVTMPPAAERSARGGVFTETQCSKSLRKRRVLRVGGHVDDRVDVLGRADA